MAFLSSRLGLLPAANDFEFALKQNNPFAHIVSQQYAPNFQAADTFGDAVAALNWDQAQRNAAANPTFGTFGPTLQHGSAFSPLLPPSTQTGTAGATPANNEYQTVSNVKNPAIQAAINASLGQVNALSTDPNRNPLITRTNVKSPDQEARIGAAGGRFDADVSNNRQSLADFTNAFLANTPETNTATNQEVGAIGEFYGGPNSVQSNLDRMANAKNAAIAAQAQRSAGMAQRGANVGRLLTGDSSYLDQQLADSLAGIGAQQAAQDADLRRTNYLAVKDAQSQLAGRRAGLLDANANRLLQPITARTALANSELGQAAQLGGLENQNNLYSLDSPEAMLQRRLGLLGNVSSLDLANTFYGVRGPRNDTRSGLLRAPDYSLPNFDMSGGASGGYGQAPARQQQTPDRRSPAAARYFAVTGQWPDSDPNYSPEAMQWVMNHNDSGAAQQYFENAGVSPYLDQNFSPELWANP